MTASAARYLSNCAERGSVLYMPFSAATVAVLSEQTMTVAPRSKPRNVMIVTTTAHNSSSPELAFWSPCNTVSARRNSSEACVKKADGKGKCKKGTRSSQFAERAPAPPCLPDASVSTKANFVGITNSDDMRWRQCTIVFMSSRVVGNSSDEPRAAYGLLAWLYNPRANTSDAALWVDTNEMFPARESISLTVYRADTSVAARSNFSSSRVRRSGLTHNLPSNRSMWRPMKTA